MQSSVEDLELIDGKRDLSCFRRYFELRDRNLNTSVIIPRLLPMS